MPTVDEIQSDLACPRCEYNLRGLRGALVNCPECGHECDVAKMVAQRWQQPWFNAPGLSAIFWPTAWSSLTGLFVTPFLFVSGVEPQSRMVTLLILVAVWCALMYRAWAVFESSEGIQLAIRAHVIFAGYLVSVAAMIGTVVLLFVAMVTPRRNTVALIAAGGFVILIPCGVALLKVCRVGERQIGERCIRRYLNRPLAN